MPATIEYPATEQQLTMLDFLGSHRDSYYIMPESFLVQGPLDIDRLRMSIKTVVARHDALRSVVGADGKTMTVTPLLEWDERSVIQCEDAQADAAEEARRGEEICTREMDLTAEWPIRVWVSRLTPNSHIVVVAGHHLVMDGWSFKNFYAEVAAAYENRPLAEPSQYWAAVTKGIPSECAFATDLFKREYVGVRDLSSRIAGSNLGPAGQLTVRRSSGAAQELRSAAGSLRTTPYTLAVSGMLSSLAETLGDNEAILGSASTGRTSGAAIRAIGYYSNTVFMGATTESLDSILGQVVGLHKQWHTTPRIQWESLLAEHSAKDLYAVKFAFERAEMARPNLDLSGLKITRISTSSPVTVARRCLDVSGSHDADGIQLTATYRTDAFDETTLTRLLDGCLDRALELGGARAN